MQKRFLLNLTFLLVLTVQCLKSETETVPPTEAVTEPVDVVKQVLDEKTVSDAVAQDNEIMIKSDNGLSAFDVLDDIDIDIIPPEPPKVTWEMLWLGAQVQLDSYMFNAKEYVAKHKLRCSLGAAGTVTAIVVIAYLIYKLKKNKTTPPIIN
ncbi:MAG: hypothetical protein US49_C0001G0030 [candidate division TM6 bacterium GW2011_GWF2_37_49]|nr:MAG: hypothetical protein US49_C0001G0030 [candidate division TM6 bacterium GW2011_GWF2_37_49]